MAVVTGGQPNNSGGTRYENIAESAKLANGGVFSNFSVPNNGNQTTTAGSVDPAEARRNLSGLSSGGTSVPKAYTQNPSVQFGTSDDTGNDWRVRISISPNSKILYWDTSSGPVTGLVAPLKTTNGFIFPFVPSVTVSHSANYQAQQLTHSNYAQYFYESSAVAAINISGDFTVQNLDDAKYFLAGLYFFRACTKMFYGNTREYQGSPPPIVYLDGYGQHYLPHVPCVVTSFSHTMPNDVDYLEVITPQSVTTTTEKATNASSYYPSNLNNQNTELTTQTINTAFNRVPTASTFSLTLQPVISRSQAVDFDYREFARGGLISGQGSAYSGGYL